MTSYLFTPNSSYIPSSTHAYKKTHLLSYKRSICRVCGEYIFHHEPDMKRSEWSRIVHTGCMSREQSRKRRDAKKDMTRRYKLITININWLLGVVV